MFDGLNRLPPGGSPADGLRQLVSSGHDRPPLPGSGATFERWRHLAAVAAHDLSLAKLFEGHTDAIAILAELGHADAAAPGTLWGTWAAEAPGGRTLIREGHGDTVRLDGAKCWCSGASHVSHGLLTAWHADGRGPQLVWLEMRQAGVEVDSAAWHAVGMAGSESVDLRFDGAVAHRVGGEGEYLSRPGFWQGGAGIAACWFGGALGIARQLRTAVEGASVARPADGFRRAALGKLDVALAGTAALLREAAAHIDAHPRSDVRATALRVRLAAEACAQRVMNEAGRALGAGPLCRDPGFARRMADLPVFVRQSHAERDFAALADVVDDSPSGWAL